MLPTLESGVSRSRFPKPLGNRTCGDVIIEVLLAAFGLPTGIASCKWLRRLSLAFCAALMAPGVVCALHNIQESVWRIITAPRSLTRVVASLSRIWFNSIAMYSAYMLLLRGKTIEPLLRRRGRRSLEFLVFVVYFFQTVMLYASLVLSDKSLMKVLRGIGSARLSLTVVVIDMIYYDAVQALLERLRQIHRGTRKSVLEWEYLVSEKWKIRDQIDAVNELFGGLISAFYLQMFLSAAFAWAQAINSSARDLKMIFSAATFFCSISAHFVLAQRASAVRSRCGRTEAALTRRLQEDPTLQRVEWKPMEHLRLHDDLDSLRIGCFVHDKANFLRFLSVVATSLAVVLQFDYVIVRTINNLSELAEISV